MKPVLELQGIVKRFPGVVANDHIDLSLNRGEIHAILGENGAGKSTLMNVLYGLFPPDEGEILLDGRPVRFQSPADAIRYGIGMVHQHFMLIPVMSVAENVMLGHESVHSGGFLKLDEVREAIRSIGDQYGLKVDPSALVGDLPVGVQQRVEIIKVIYRDAKILILDEPTAVLTPQEVDELFVILRSLADGGHSLFFITHKLREALRLADRITVLRNGRAVGTTTPEETSEGELASMMVGRDVVLQVEKEPSRPKEPVLKVSDLWIAGAHQETGRRQDLESVPSIRGVSFEVRSGEIVGIAGVQGNGQTELMEALAGLRPVAQGTIEVEGVDTSSASPRQITELGVGYVPEDRQLDGLVLSFSVEDNLVLKDYYHTPYSNRGWIDRPSIRRQAERLVDEFDVRTRSVTAPVGSLSGGNQQKVIIARELSRSIRLLLASQPTRGVDVGSIEYIHRRLVEARDNGVGVLLVSTELDEILSLSDRILVMYQGQIVGSFSAEEADRNRIGLMMAGAA